MLEVKTRANSRHKAEEVPATINKLNSKYPQALLTMEDLSAIVTMVSATSDKDGSKSEENVRWIEDEDEDEHSDLV